MVMQVISLLMWPAVILVSYLVSTRVVMRFDRKYKEKQGE